MNRGHLSHIRRRMGVMTIAEAAERMGISRALAQKIEYGALRKLAADPAIRRLAEQFGVINELHETTPGGAA